MRHAMAWVKRLGSVLGTAVIGLGIGWQATQAQTLTWSPAAETSPETLTSLEQGWGGAEREAFWFTSQGSQILSYDIFTNLEQEGSEGLFREAANLEGFGYIAWPAGPKNPDGLPIGFVRDRDPATKREWMGFTCAACHTGIVDHGGRSFLVDGAPTLADFTGFFAALVDAMRANQEDPKFDRLAARVLGQDADAGAKALLLKRLREETAALGARKDRNESGTAYGNGRLDAFGQIFNEVTAHDLGVATNTHAPDAPVSYPFLWGTPQSDVVQWNGAAENRPPIGALTRNVGEVLGVFGYLPIAPSRKPEGYPSSVRLTALAGLENLLERLWRPSWQEAGLPLDSELVARGEAIYAQRCSGCHQVLEDPTDRFRRIEAKMSPLADIGTDPRMAVNALRAGQLTGRLEGHMKRIILGDPRDTFGPEAASLEIVGNAVVGTLLGDLPGTFEAIAIDRLNLTPVELELAATRAPTADAAPNGADFQAILRDTSGDAPVADRLRAYRQAMEARTGISVAALARRLQANASGALQGGQASNPAALLAYKARPLDGIWATAPYLHNGSVPTLADLLRPPADRPETFKVGSRELDPVKIGFSSELAGNGSFVFDTRLAGNDNDGHDYGTDLSDEDKAALLEYLKSL